MYMHVCHTRLRHTFRCSMISIHSSEYIWHAWSGELKFPHASSFSKKKKNLYHIYILYPLSFLLSLTSYMHEDVHIWKKMINTSILQLLFVQSKLIFWCYFHMANLIVSLVYFFLFILTMKLLKLDCIRSNNSWSGRSIKLQSKIREKHNFIWVLLWSRWKRFKILQYAWTTTMNQHIAILDIH